MKAISPSHLLEPLELDNVIQAIHTSLEDMNSAIWYCMVCKMVTI